MTGLKKNSVFIFFNFLVLFSIAQEGTRTTQTTVPGTVGKIMIVPFEPKLYMSEIDMKVNQQTKWEFEKIRENFRRQLNNQLKSKLQSTAPVVSFYSDSAKMSKDLMYIYQSTDLSYDLVSNPNPNSQPVKKSGIKNGQIAVEINTDKKFMNIKMNDPKALDYLYKKYKTDYFVFINQLDIVNNPESYNLATDTYMRDVTVHYTILDKTGKYIAAGAATSQFSSKENDPKKIVSTSFAPIATYISGKLANVVKPEKTTAPKNK
ncbi:MAG: hypothetical protein WAQ28_10825 [Bacteroidia bacterium]|jgi:hypothetical protein